MKVGDEVIYINDNPYKYSDDLYWDEDNFLVKYEKYTISEIKMDIDITDNSYYSLILEGCHLTFNTDRFMLPQHYRKLKLQQINESWR